jgi:small subunit ribosomal protein S9
MAETLTPVEESTTTAPATPAKRRSKSEAGSCWTVGRRKCAVARIKLVLGKGDITINDRPVDLYFTDNLVRSRMMAPLVLLERRDSFDISIKVAGGGPMSQSDAIAHGIARALTMYDAELRSSLKKAGMLTRDARVKERKKYGLRRARKAPQYSKR